MHVLLLYSNLNYSSFFLFLNLVLVLLSVSVVSTWSSIFDAEFLVALVREST